MLEPSQAWKCLMSSKLAKKALSEPKTRPGDLIQGKQIRPGSALQQGLKSHYSSSWCFLDMARDVISGAVAAMERAGRAACPTARSHCRMVKQSHPAPGPDISQRRPQEITKGPVSRPWNLPGNLVFCPGATHQEGKELFAEEVQGGLLSTCKCNSASDPSGGKREL